MFPKTTTTDAKEKRRKAEARGSQQTPASGLGGRLPHWQTTEASPPNPHTHCPKSALSLSKDFYFFHSLYLDLWHLNGLVQLHFTCRLKIKINLF